VRFAKRLIATVAGDIADGSTAHWTAYETSAWRVDGDGAAPLDHGFPVRAPQATATALAGYILGQRDDDGIPAYAFEPWNGRTATAGTYRGSTAPLVSMPNGDQAADFNGSNGYMSIPSNAAFSIPTTHSLTWEAWIRPDTLQFPKNSNGYVDWMGKCQDYDPTCEWEARLYNTTNSENRCNRFSAYVFNSSAGLGSGAYWQPTCGLIQAGQWYHVVGEYTTLSQPSGCQNASQYPGVVAIWLNGVPWNQSSHGQTGCFSQYDVVPTANSSPVNVGTMAMDAFFQGAIGKVAIYDKLLSQAQITAHYMLMTGKAPTGSCSSDCSF